MNYGPMYLLNRRAYTWDMSVLYQSTSKAIGDSWRKTSQGDEAEQHRILAGKVILESV